MAPRRSVKISAPEKRVSAVPDKLRETRRKNIKPLKVPSVITISIPVNKSGLDVPDSEKKIDLNTKKALADEVARSQLLKEPIEVRMKPPAPKKKRGRKKQLLEVEEIKQEPEEETKPTTASTVQKSNKKLPIKVQTTTKKVATRKRAADATVEKPAIKRQRQILKPVDDKQVPKINNTEQQKSETNTTDQQTESEIKALEPKQPSKVGIKNQKSPIVNSKDQKPLSKVESIETKAQQNDENEVKISKKCVKNKQETNCNPFTPPKLSTPNLRKRLTRGKPVCTTTPEKTLQPTSEASCTKSPITLSPCSKSPKPGTANNKSANPELSSLKALRLRSPKPLVSSVKPAQKEAETSKGNNTVPMISHRNSTSSISNLSWTRDISNSSTTTCITVSSNDFVCIDKKIPLIKLTNVDSEIDKYKRKPASSDEDDSSSDDSSSSDSDTSSKKQLTDSRISPSRCASVKVNSLHLSSSSRNSVVENPIEEHNLNKIDYGKAAEKLMQALNKIDMEFINWIHDSDFATTDLNKIKDNLFTILNNEFCALRHCRILQDISKSEKTNPKVVTNEPEVVAIENTENKKLQTVTVESNETNLSKLEHNNIEPITVTTVNLVNSTESEGGPVKRKNIESDTAPKKLKSNQSREVIRYSTETSPARSNRIENDAVASNKSRVETGQITSKADESYAEEAFIKPSTSGFAAYTKPRQVSELNDSSSESEGFSDFNAFIQNAHDDDDALSLFAESITGIESSKVNTSLVSAPLEKQIEEYVPKPIQKHLVPPPNYSYCPTKISEHGKNGIVKTVCEKQNADSTSIHKELNNLPPQFKESVSIADSIESNQEITPKPSIIEANSPFNSNKPPLIANLYKLMPNEHNVIFKGYCYKNMFHRCPGVLYGKQCRYSHDIPSEQVVSLKLADLSTKVLLKEYMLIRRNEHIMRRFGMCVLFECVKRQLTRVVVEIAYDFITKGVKGLQIDETLKVAAVEVALLHLNTVDLSVCEDLLKLRVGESLLCEIFMQIMTGTQNFSRFKSVFLSLTYFMVNNDRTFNLEVTEQILERVCILPFDEAVVRALIQIMRLTNPEIFLNSMINNFENLIKSKRDVYDEYIIVKGEVNKLVRREAEQSPTFGNQTVEQPQLLHPVTQPLRIQAVDQPLNARSEMREGVPLPPSPDTTHLDSMNKMAEDTVVPKITRTILGFRSTPNSQTADISPSSSINEEIVHNPNPKNWKNRSIFQHIARTNFSSPRQPMPFGRLSRPPRRLIRTRQFNHRHVTLGGSPITYPPPGQDF